MMHGLTRVLVLIAFAAVVLVWTYSTVLVGLQYLQVGLVVWDARNHCQQVEGRILVSELHAAHSRNQSRYWPYFRCQIPPDPTPTHDATSTADQAAPFPTLDAPPGVAVRYRPDGYSVQPDQALAQRIIAAYPVGSLHPLWFDPREPSSYTLELKLPHFYWLNVLFLQPFIAASVGLLLGLITSIGNWRSRQRCLADELRPGWRIPGWGSVVADPRGWHIGSHIPALRIVITVLTSYAAMSLIAYGIIAVTLAHEESFIAHGQAMLLVMLSCLLGAGAATYALRNQLRLPCLRFDAGDRQLTYVTTSAAITIPLSSLRSWKVRLQQVAAKQPIALYEVCVNRSDGTFLAVHQFYHQDLAEHVAKQFALHAVAQATVPLTKPSRPDDDLADAPGNAQSALRRSRNSSR